MVAEVLESPQQEQEQRRHRPHRHHAEDQDVILVVERAHPRISPGDYQAVSKTTRVRNIHNGGRRYLEVFFDVFEGEITDGVILARDVPGYFNMGEGKRIGRSSKLARWIQLLDPATRPRLDRVPTKLLRDKFWLVRVVDVKLNSERQELPQANWYSKVDAILKRVA
jgi:hypothetical protein